LGGDDPVCGDRRDHQRAGAEVRIEGAHRFLGGHRAECANREAARQPPGDLGRTQDRGVADRLGVPRLGITRWRRANPPGVEGVPSPEQVAPLDEEWTPLVEEGLEGAQVHFRGVGLHLAEVRVDGGIERQGGSEPDLEIAAQADRRPGATGEGIVGIDLAESSALHGDVWQEFHACRRPQGSQSGQPAHPRRPAVLLASHEHPVRGRIAVRHPAHDVEPPVPIGPGVEAELRERNPRFGRPPVVVHRGGHRPNGIPRLVLPVEAVGRMEDVAPGAARGDQERVRGDAIVAGVEGDPQFLGRHPAVASADQGPDPARGASVHPGPDDEVMVGDQESNLGRVAGGDPLHRLSLDEVRGRHRRGPDRLIEATIDPDLSAGRPDGANLRLAGLTG
jgi:hypothetical protein